MALVRTLEIRLILAAAFFSWEFFVMTRHRQSFMKNLIKKHRTKNLKGKKKKVMKMFSVFIPGFVQRGDIVLWTHKKIRKMFLPRNNRKSLIPYYRYFALQQNIFCEKNKYWDFAGFYLLIVVARRMLRTTEVHHLFFFLRDPSL